MAAMQQLLHLVDSHPGGLKEVDLLSTIGIRQIDLVEEMTNIRSMEASIGGMFHCVDHPRFDTQVGWLFFFQNKQYSILVKFGRFASSRRYVRQARYDKNLLKNGVSFLRG